MTIEPRPLCAALLALAGACAQAQSGPEFKFGGFGTFGLAHSDERNADFVSTIFEPNGAGMTRRWSFNPDTRIGGQVDAIFSERWSAVLQLIAQHHHDNSYLPQVEWANLKFQATPELSVRVGRIATPSFLLSDTRYIGYAQPWVRPPVEVYGVLPITKNDGIDLVYRTPVGAVTNTVQAYYGRSTVRLDTGIGRTRPAWGINDAVQAGDLTLRAGYSSNRLDLDLAGVNSLVAGFNAFTAVPGPIGAQAGTLLQKYSLQDIKLGAFSLAAGYDPGDWFAQAEFVAFRGKSIFADSRSWYAAAGYRHGRFTPYLSYGRTKADLQPEPGLPLPVAAPLNDGLNALLNNQFNASQSTLSAGLRWDFAPNLALKLQFDHIKLGANSAGRLLNPQPALARGGNVNLFSAALDFVF